jgi:hypothetical protein
MTGRKHAVAAIAAALTVAGLLAVGVGAVAARGHSRTDSGTIYAATTHSTPSGIAFTAGQGTSKLFGPIAITYRIKAQSTPTGTFHLTVNPVIEYTKKGSISGTSTATLIATSTGTSVTGKVSLTHGTGALAGHKLVGTFSGTGTASGQYVFHYKDTYK